MRWNKIQDLLDRILIHGFCGDFDIVHGWNLWLHSTIYYPFNLINLLHNPYSTVPKLEWYYFISILKLLLTCRWWTLSLVAVFALLMNTRPSNSNGMVWMGFINYATYHMLNMQRIVCFKKLNNFTVITDLEETLELSSRITNFPTNSQKWIFSWKFNISSTQYSDGITCAKLI